MAETMNRRNFIKAAARSTAGAGLAASALGVPRPVAASDKVRVGVIGTGGEGRNVMSDFLKQPDVDVVAVCDVYRPNLDQALKDTGGKAKDYKDFREVLDRKDIDAVLIASPDHWHALQTVLACQSGKDVYVEKPIANCIEECRRMVEAARKHNRVVQVGTEWRSNAHFQKGVELIHDGLIGKVSFVRTWNYLNLFPDGYGNYEDSEPPANLDWDLWLGPAPKAPFNWNRFGVKWQMPGSWVSPQANWSTFRYFWDYAGGWMTDWGIHFINVIHWAMKVDGPHAAVASGGKWYLQDNTETPDTLLVSLEYPGFLATYENRLCNQNSKHAIHEYVGNDPDLLRDWGMQFHGSNGTLTLDQTGVQVNPETRSSGQKQVDRTPAMEMTGFEEVYGPHVRNFVDCIKSRQRPVSDIEIGQRATNSCHLANIAYRTQSRVGWDPASQTPVQPGPEVRKLLSVAYRSPWTMVI